jgi:hypothetical protein
MSEAPLGKVPPVEYVHLAERILYPDEAYLAALQGLHIPEREPGRAVSIAAAARLGIPTPEGEGDGRLLGAPEVAEELRRYPPPLVVLQSAAEILGGHKTPGVKAATIAATGVEALSSLVELPLDIASRLAGPKHPIVSGLARGASNAVALSALGANHLANRSLAEVERASSRLVNYRYGLHFAEAAELAPWMWGNLLGRLCRTDVVPEAVVRVALRFLESYRASVQSQRALQLNRAYEGVRAYEGYLAKMAHILDRGSPLDERSKLVLEMLNNRIADVVAPPSRRYSLSNE